MFRYDVYAGKTFFKHFSPIKLIWLANPNKDTSGQHIFLGLLDILDTTLRICLRKNSPTFGKQDNTVFNFPSSAYFLPFTYKRDLALSTEAICVI